MRHLHKALAAIAVTATLGTSVACSSDGSGDASATAPSVSSTSGGAEGVSPGAAGPTAGSGASGSGAPGSGAPGSGTPGSGAPGSGTPGSGAPGSGTPSTGAPGSGSATTAAPDTGSGGGPSPGTGTAGPAASGSGTAASPGVQPGPVGAGGTGQTPAPGPEDTYPPLTEPPPDEDGSELWLRYPQVSLPARLAEYQALFTEVVQAGDTPTLQAAESELLRGLSGLTGRDVPSVAAPDGDGAVVLGTPDSSDIVASSSLAGRLAQLGNEGYLVETVGDPGQRVTIVGANSDIGVLYGAFALLRHLQTHQPTDALSLEGSPKITRRLLDHWDNLDGSIERGYAGRSLWNWNALPGTLSARYTDYARANASIGVNGAVLNNVNADAQILTTQYLDKVKALADVFRPYGIAVYLTARFSAPIEIGGLSTADPGSTEVQQWWSSKADEIYQRIPDFGGFLVKANSEGQPGPQDYGRSHADGANMLASALAPHGGIVMWRAFVYSEDGSSDRIAQAYDEFQPLDGQFDDNVFIQAKNGPLDFQPREPFHPLFGAMPQTSLALELQITKEYLGEDTHLVYLGPLYEEVLQSDTFAQGEGSTVARVIDGSLDNHGTSVIAGVSNVGSDANWTGSHFNQANWYVFGRLAWDPDASSEAIAEEWVRQTFSNDPEVVAPVTEMMMQSRQAVVDYMTPLGLVHIMASDHHYGPGPWVDNLGRADWNPVYFHRADAMGLGFDRTASGSNAVAQYFQPLRDELSNRDQVPLDYLLFFHHVGWNEQLSTGRTLWEELVYRYSTGVDAVGTMQDAWQAVQGRIDTQRFDEVNEYLGIQHYEARWWRDACLQYFRSFANLDIPSGYAQPEHDLAFYKGLTCPPDVTKPRCTPVYDGEPSPAITP